jgi:endonuclease YncB( thermonuclease family)
VALDDETIREFLETTYPRLVAAVALVAGSRDAAEDAVQEALARAWERAGTEQIRSLPARRPNASERPRSISRLILDPMWSRRSRASPAGSEK